MGHSKILKNNIIERQHDTMNKTQIIDELKRKNEIYSDEFDGTHNSVKSAVFCYSKLKKTSIIDYNDLELLYYLSLGLWETSDNAKKNYIKKTHLLFNDKMSLERNIDSWWSVGARKLFTHIVTEEEAAALNTIVSFRDTEIAKDAGAVQLFINICTTVSDLDDDEPMYICTQKMLNDRIRNAGITIDMVSRILHCIKPFTFPIINNSEVCRNFYEKLGLKLADVDDVRKYIFNTRKIKEFRDANFKFKSMRILDLYSWELIEKEKREKEKENEKDDSAPENSVPETARKENTAKENFSKIAITKPETAPERKTIKIATHKARASFNAPLNQILYGPPGTGKTYNVIRYAVELVEGKKLPKDENYADIKERYEQYITSGQIKFTTFHQAYSYEEFVEGIRPVVVDKYGHETSVAHADTTIVYRVFNGVFKSLCETASMSPFKNYVSIIDEINRGNISRIFGELITLIEESKRGTPAILPYSQAQFAVPPNLYILGTMNTADRSIAMLDTALRRRFDFIEMMPKPELLGNCAGVDLNELLTAINERIEYYYDREHAIGHAYFMRKNGSITTLDELRNVFDSKIIPLLQEYFFDDYEKIKLILNDENKFIECISPKYIRRFDSGQKLYRLGNPQKWSKEDFINIYKINS